MAALSELYAKGSRVWVRDENDVWAPASVLIEPNDSRLRLEREDAQIVELRVNKENDYPPLRNPDILVGLNDLTTLSYLHEPAVLHNLKVRFLHSNTIYTYCGIVLVAINPYEQLPIYGNDVIDAYRGQSMSQMDPHVFAVAEEAYNKMSREKKNQSIIVSGESGAGKTVSAKYAMRYFATVGGASAETQIERKVLASNPIMEAFGNAKTIRNDNSSRFGKYIEIDFNHRHCIIGAHMRTYLLEKSRVVFQASNERNYHIFYQICAAREQPQLEELNLVSADDFFYTNLGGDIHVENVNDGLDFGATCNAFSLLNISENEQREIFKVVAALLHLGNVKFCKKSRRAEDAAIQKDVGHSHLASCASLLGIDIQMLQKWLCNRKIVTKKEVFTKPLSVEQACGARDGLAKHLYAQLFSWIVKQINKCLTSPAKRKSFIGVLDIYGFETFDVNSFEQFCINYANEKLQQQFTQHVFKLEQEEYVKEQIEWSFIDFYDNQPCIDLIESRLGILDLLDEECKMPNGTDKEWLEKMYQNLKERHHFAKPRLSNTAFIVKHFAGEVEYESESFLAKNKDAIVEEHVAILKASKYELVGELFGEEKRSATKKRSATVGSQFSNSLVDLMKALNATVPHYIRCIKPNDDKEAFSFDPKRAIQQLRACGVLETVRISAAGFPSRWSYAEFFDRYRVLVHSSKAKRNSVRETCEFILNHFIKDPDKFQFGKTKIFFRAGQVAYLEKLRADKLRACGIRIQKHIRGWLHRTKYRRMKRAAIRIQAHVRALIARRLTQFLRETKASICIQRHFRGYLQRVSYGKARRAIVTMQRFTRGMFGRRVYRELLREAKAIVIQTNYRMFIERRRYLTKRKAVIYLECCVRRMRARRELRTLKIEARSVDHYKKLNSGLENKIITLQIKLNEKVGEIEKMKGMKSEIGGYVEEVETLKKKAEDDKEKLSKLKEMEGELIELRRERDELKTKLESLEIETKLTMEQKEEEMNRLKVEAEELRSKVSQAEERARIGSASEEANLSSAVEKERSNLMAEFELERVHHQHTLKEQSRLQQRIENLQEDLNLVNRERRNLEAWKLEHGSGGRGSAMSVRSAVDGESAALSSRAQSLENMLDTDDSPQLLVMKLNERIRELEARNDDEEELRRKLDNVVKENEKLEKLVAEGSSTILANDVFSTSTPIDRISIRSVDVDDERDAVQQITALKDANYVLQKELEEGQKKTDNLLKEFEEKVLKLEEDLTKAQNQVKKNHPSRQQSLDQKLSQEVTRLTVENFDLMEKNEHLEKRIKELRRQGAQTPEIDGAKTAVAPSLPSLPPSEPQFMGMFEYERQDETKLFRRLIVDLDPAIVKDCLPGLPAHILFMCLRYCDHMNDALRMEHLLTGIITSVRKVVSRRSKDDFLIAFWLSNICRFLHDMKQYGGDNLSLPSSPSSPPLTTSSGGEKPVYASQCLKQFDITEYRMVFNDLAVHVYQALIKLIQDRLQPMIVCGLLEHESIPGVSHSKPFGLRPISTAKGAHPGASAYTVDSVVKELTRIYSVLTNEYVDPSIVRQLFRQVFYMIGAYMLNNLLLRKDMCHWSRGMQIRYNLSQLEEWCRRNHLGESGAIEALGPIIQACQLLQVCKKIQSDVATIFEMCYALNPLQIQKILTMYTPTNEFEERVPVSVIRSVVAHGADRADPSRLMMDINYQYSITFPFTQLDVNLATILLPAKLKLNFLKKI